MSPLMGGFKDLIDCFPRVSGDEPSYATLKDYRFTFSPRERG